MSEDIIIALAGYARAGKDTVADYLVEQHGFTKLAFADPLKNIVRESDYPLTFLDGSGPVTVKDVESMSAFFRAAVDLAKAQVKEAEYLADLAKDPEAVAEYEALQRGVGAHAEHLLKKETNYREVLQKMGDAIRGIDPGFFVAGLDVQICALFDSNTRKGLPTRVVIPDVRYENECGAIWDWWPTMFKYCFEVTRDGVGPANDHPSETEHQQFMDEYTTLSMDGDWRKQLDDLLREPEVANG